MDLDHHHHLVADQADQADRHKVLGDRVPGDKIRQDGGKIRHHGGNKVRNNHQEENHQEEDRQEEDHQEGKDRYLHHCRPTKRSTLAQHPHRQRQPNHKETLYSLAIGRKCSVWLMSLLQAKQ